MKLVIDYEVYLVTDRSFLNGRSIEKCVEEAIVGGCGIVQLREKHINSQEFYSYAVRLRGVTRHYGVPLIINDRLDIAMAVGADGVHIGQDDLELSVVRSLIGKDKIIGVSVHNLETALYAARGGADYLGVGAMFATATKHDALSTSLEELVSIRKNVGIPIIAIGGINKTTISALYETGIDGVAVVSAILQAQDCAEATRLLKEQCIRLHR